MNPPKTQQHGEIPRPSYTAGSEMGLLELTRHQRFINGQWDIFDILVRASQRRGLQENPPAG